MFVLTTVIDTVKVPPHLFALPTLTAIHQQIDLKYPNRILMDVGLVICRHGSCDKISNGSCVPGEGGGHHECLFKLVVFRPFVEEVCVGTIVKSTPEGIQVSLGFFQDVFIPAYWMLRPSKYEEKTGLWVWTPDFGDEDAEEGEGSAEVVPVTVKSEPIENISGDGNDLEKKEKDGEEEEEGYDMNIGEEIRFKVKSIQFTQVTNTAKGIQATTTTTSHSHSIPEQDNKGERTTSLDMEPIKRKRSLSVDLSAEQALPASMKIVASICEDGLGLTSWWTSTEDEDEAQEEEHGGGDAAEEEE